MLTGVAVALVACELIVRAMPTSTDEGTALHRAPNVIALARHMTDLPPPSPTRPQLLFVGSSQAYGIGGRNRGDMPTLDGDGTTIDSLASQIGIATADYVRLADQGLLPFEELAAVQRLYQVGYSPKVVVMSWAWTFFARDRNVRPWVRDLFRDAAYAKSFEAVLEAHHAKPELLETFRAQRALAEIEVAAEQNRSSADRADLAITEVASRHIALIGRNADVRSRLYMAVIEHGSGLLTGGNLTAVREVVDADLTFSLECMRVLIEELDAHGVRTLAFLSPERSDYPPLTNEARLDEVMGGLAQRLAPNGLILVDGRKVVPPQYFGWSAEYPDRAHFGLEGHALVGAFLANELKRNHMLDPLSPR